MIEINFWMNMDTKRGYFILREWIVQFFHIIKTFLLIEKIRFPPPKIFCVKLS